MPGLYLHGEELMLWYAAFLLLCLAALIFAAYAIYKMLRGGKK